MYTIYIDNGDGKEIFYKPTAEGLALYDINYHSEMGKAGSLSFTVPATHDKWSKVQPINTMFWLYKDDEPVFRGRYVGNKEDFYKTGEITCEGDLNFLIDSLQDPYDYTGSIIDFFTAMINNHNSMVESKKQFKVGRCTVIDDNNYINRSDEDYSTTLEALKDKLIETHGGYLRTRYESDGVYIDYVTDYGGINNQKIRFGENLLDLSKQIDASSIITCLIPVGADLDNGEDGVKGKLDISSVNNGKKYIVNTEAVEKYGQIWGTKEWDEVTEPSHLLAKAKVYLEEQTVLPQSFELTALDLSLINTNVDEFNLGWWTDIISDQHDIRGQYLLQEVDIDISSPENSKLTLGGTVNYLSGNVAKNLADVSRKVNQTKKTMTKWFENAIDEATTLIRGGLGGYVVMPANDDTGYPEEILIMDAPIKENAVNVIRFNKNGIGFSTSGYDGVYRNAWTIDGHLVADFIDTGTMTAITIQNAKEGDRLVIDQTSSLKGYRGDSLINLINVAQTSGTTQLTIDAANQLNIRTPKIVVENASHGEAASTGTVALTGDCTFECVVGKYYADERSDVHEHYWLYGDPNTLEVSGSCYFTAPVLLKMQNKSFKSINGFTVSNSKSATYVL